MKQAANISSADTMGRYQRLSGMRLKSMDRFTKFRTPVAPLSRLTSSSAAAIIGQKAMSRLTDSPGINCRSETLPSNQKGADSANTSTKNVNGDLFVTANGPAEATAAKLQRPNWRSNIDSIAATAISQLGQKS